MALMTVAELRALVGQAGADLSDEQLLRMDAFGEIVADVLVQSFRDRQNPQAAAQRREQARLQLQRELAPRRRRYQRERARAIAARRSA